MTESRDNALTFAAKLGRLFDVCRSRGQPEQSTEEVARAVSQIIGRPITSNQICALRDENSAAPDRDIVRGLVRHFGVPVDYLTSTGAHAEHVDKQLQLLAAARDAGIKWLALRGNPTIDGLTNMFAMIAKAPAEEH